MEEWLEVLSEEEDQQLPVVGDRDPAVDLQVRNAGTMEMDPEGTEVQQRVMVVSLKGSEAPVLGLYFH